MTKQPQGASYGYGAKASALTVEAVADDNVELSYQWYKSGSGSNKDGAKIAGATQASYVPPTTEAGACDYYCKVTGTDEGRIGIKSKSVTTDPARITVAKAPNAIRLQKNAYTLSGKEKAQTLTVEFAQKPQAPVTYTSNDKSAAVDARTGKITIPAYYAGTFTITVRSEDANYSAAEDRITVTVKPAAVLIKKVTAQKGKKALVTWKKTAGADGYRIAYSTGKSFAKKSTKTLTVKGASKIKATLQGLKKGKTYYVRICAYKGKLTGAWSRSKTVKIRK